MSFVYTKSRLGLAMFAVSFSICCSVHCTAQVASLVTESAISKPVVADRFVSCSYQQGMFDGYLGQRMQINLEKRLLKLDLDSILRPFEQRPGQQMWVGEHVGKWLHAATLYWEQTRDPRIKAKMDETVRRLLATQLEDGYLGTYKPEDHWTSWDVWSHKYNLIGLLAYYRVTDDEDAFRACRRIGDLLASTFGSGEGQLDIVDSKHSTHVGMASGSVLEPMVMLHRYTGDERYLQFCNYIVDAWEQPHGPKLISSLLEKEGNVLRTANNKSYEMMSCLVGCLELYRVTGDQRLLDACRSAWEDIREKRLYVIGSSSWAEHFRDDHDLYAEGEYRGSKFCSTSEGCVSVTWMQLSFQLLQLTGQSKYAEELERTIYNALLASQSPHSGEVSYFLALLGDRKRYGEVTHGIAPDVCCCASSVPRGLALIPQMTAGVIGELPRSWFGGQLYRVKLGESQEQTLTLVPFAEAGQMGGDYDVLLDRGAALKTPPELDPIGAVHLPIGLPNSLDSLKTFVEAEGGFSPGVGSFGVSFWVYDWEDDELRSPTMDEVDCSHGLADGRALIPWSEWNAGGVRVRTEVCEVRRESSEGTDSYLVGARARLANPTDQPRQVSLYVALRPVGPAGNAVPRLAVSEEEDALLVAGHPALVTDRVASAISVSPTDSIGGLAMRNAGADVGVPGERWSLGFDVMLAHAGLCMNEGAADVAVTNYTVFNRDGIYIANMMQKAGRPQLSEAVIDYFLRSPFNGRPFPESDNPGQVLWSIGQHWRMTRDEAWLRRVYPAAEKLAKMIEYYRTTEGPYWVSLTSLEFGDALPEEQRLKLEPGRCDGFHPEYTEAFDVTGLRVVAELGEAIGESDRAASWRSLADRLFQEYDDKFGRQLPKGYGSYCVLWPCRLYPSTQGPAHDQFVALGKQELSNWRYFAPATAHQSLLAGNRAAGHETVDLHLDHPQMKGWFAFDEGGRSGSGGWQHLRTTWTHSKTEPDKNHAVAMPHGWAIAEVWLLIRDCLVHEVDGCLSLLAGVSPEWFTDPAGMHVENLPTEFGRCTFRYEPTDGGAVMTISGTASPPGGFVICLPPDLNAQAHLDGKPVEVKKDGRCFVPANARRVEWIFPQRP